VAAYGKPLSRAVRLDLTLLTRKKEELVSYRAVEIRTFRESPIGDLYAPVLTQGLAAEFPPVGSDAKPAAKSEEKPRRPRPNFGPVPAAK
jgi:hypothetical protein